MKTNEVLENIKARRSVRAYTGQQVLEEDLQAILEAATYAPSGMHLETWHFTAIQNMDKLTELNERIKGAFAKSDDSRLQERGHSKTYCCYYHAPTLVIVSNEPTQWWAGMDCACAIENMFQISLDRPLFTRKYHSEWVVAYGLPRCYLRELHLSRIYYHVHFL